MFIYVEIHDDIPGLLPVHDAAGVDLLSGVVQKCIVATKIWEGSYVQATVTSLQKVNTCH